MAKKQLGVAPSNAKDVVTKEYADALSGGGSAFTWYVGSDAFASGILSVVQTGDRFSYNDGGAHPGWTYDWNGTTWAYVMNLRGSPTDAEFDGGDATSTYVTTAFNGGTASG